MRRSCLCSKSHLRLSYFHLSSNCRFYLTLRHSTLRLCPRIRYNLEVLNKFCSYNHCGTHRYRSGMFHVQSSVVILECTHRMGLCCMGCCSPGDDLHIVPCWLPLHSSGDFRVLGISRCERIALLHMTLNMHCKSKLSKQTHGTDCCCIAAENSACGRYYNCPPLLLRRQNCGR